MFADLTVLDRDPFANGSQGDGGCRVLATMIGGCLRFSALIRRRMPPAVAEQVPRPVTGKAGDRRR